MSVFETVGVAAIMSVFETVGVMSVFEKVGRSI